MSTAGLIALFVIFSSICAKMFFSLRIRSYDRARTMENETFQNTRNELHKIEQKNKLQAAEIRQLDARKKTTERSIKTVEKTLNELKTRKETDDSERAYQAAIIKGEKPK